MMKTNSKIKMLVIRLSTAMAMILMLTNCGSSGSNSTTATATGYYMTNGSCYTTAGQIVSTAYCTSTASTTGYTYSNGSCISTTTGQVVSTAYCTATTGLTSTYGTTACVGYYYYYVGTGSPQVGYCNGTNCHGTGYYTYPGQAAVTCQ